MENTEFELWHYTTLDGLKGILSDKTLWATHYRYLNDSSEFLYSQSIIQQVALPRVVSIIANECEKNPDAQRIAEANGGIQNLAKIETDETISEIIFPALLESSSLSQIPFVLSFCKVPKNDMFLNKNGLLSQWRGYGKNGGYAIIFDFEEIINEFKIEEKSFYHGIATHGNIVYGTNGLTKEIKEALGKISDHVYEIYHFRLHRGQRPVVTPDELSSLFSCVALLKHEGFKEENEYRFCTVSYCKDAQHNKNFVEDKNKDFKIIMTTNKKGVLVPYIRLFEKSKNLPIKGICIGPHRDKKLKLESVKTYLRNLGLSNIEVFCSEIPYVG